MAASHAFLARLGLETDADERQVRRAYARELKQIDQERDLEGFQHLRACYEAALRWAAQRAAQAEHVEPAPATVQAPVPQETVAALAGEAPAPGPAPAPALQEDEGENPVALGESVFADFRARMPALAARPERMGQDDDARIAPWLEALREALADPRLVHLYARVVFEHRIAALLAEGWAPGHHLLLPAAVETFGWNQDRRALERLGRAGALVDEALEQRAMFGSQDIAARTRQREVLFLLRQGVGAEEGTLRFYAPALVALTDYFPTLLGVVAPHDVAAAWRAQVNDDMVHAAERMEAAQAAPSAADRDARPWWKGGKSPRLAAAIALFLLVRLFAFFGSHDTQPPVGGASHGFPRLGEDEGTKRERLRHPKPIYEDEPLGNDRIEAIRRLIHYRPGKDVAPGEQSAEFQVVLDADGSILGMNRLRAVGDPAYAAAVRQAIIDSGPFPPKVSKSLRIGFRAEVGAPALPRERAMEIGRRIDYRPGKDVARGEQHVEFDVLLNDVGAIRRLSVRQAPRDPAYAAAVEQAIRLGAPYKRGVPRAFRLGFKYTPDRKSPPSATAAHRRDNAAAPEEPASVPPPDAT